MEHILVRSSCLTLHTNLPRAQSLKARSSVTRTAFCSPVSVELTSAPCDRATGGMRFVRGGTLGTPSTRTMQPSSYRSRQPSRQSQVRTD